MRRRRRYEGVRGTMPTSAASPASASRNKRTEVRDYIFTIRLNLMASHGPLRIGIQRANFTISLTSKSTQPYQRGRASITGLRRIKAESLTAESSKNPEFRTAVPSFDQKSKIITRKSPQNPSPPFHRPGSAPPRLSPTSDLHFLPFDVPRWKFDVRCSPSSIVPAPRPPRPLRGKL